MSIYDALNVIHAADGKSTYYTLAASSLGIFLSICAFVLLILTAALFAEWRRNYKNQLIIQFTLARILYTCMRYMHDIQYVFVLCDFKCFIYFDFIVLIYSECTLVSWMFVFSKLMNDSLVKVFNVPKTSIWKVTFYTWTMPAIVSGLLYLSYYVQTGREEYVFFLYLFIIKWPVLCANGVLLIQALRSVLNTNQSRTQYNARIVIVMIGLIFVFSFQQILMDIFKLIHLLRRVKYNTLFVTVINILAIYQCAFSILFWVFGNANTRKLWRHKNSKLKA